MQSIIIKVMKTSKSPTKEEIKAMTSVKKKRSAEIARLEERLCDARMLGNRATIQLYELLLKRIKRRL